MKIVYRTLDSAVFPPPSLGLDSMCDAVLEDPDSPTYRCSDTHHSPASLPYGTLKHRAHIVFHSAASHSRVNAEITWSDPIPEPQRLPQ